jgi:hypothetical protein
MIGDKIIDIGLDFGVLPVTLTEGCNRKSVRLMGLALMLPWVPGMFIGLGIMFLGLMVSIIEEA